jgi:hypothetical protein
MEDFENFETDSAQSASSAQGVTFDSLDIGFQTLSSIPSNDLHHLAEETALPGELAEIGSAIAESSGQAIAHAAEGLGETAGYLIEGAGEAISAIGEAIGELLSGT